MIWRLRRRTLDLSRRGVIMGVLNVTPDSFSDGGSFFLTDDAVERARHLMAEGADIIDIGGESTRPGAEPVSALDEVARVAPVIAAIRKESDIPISIDTSKAVVAAAALEAGADLVNDVTALGDPLMAPLLAEYEAGAILMHMQGEPRTMQRAPRYDDVVTEVMEFLRQRIAVALGCGMAVESMAVDPGIGFGKTSEHNLSLLANVGRLLALERPVVVGVSRKSFLAKVTGAEAMEERLAPGVAVTALARAAGARIFRVHDPRPHAAALRITEAIHA